MTLDATVLSVDIGTSSLKAALVSSDGSVKAFSQQYFTAKSETIALQWLSALYKAAESFVHLRTTIQGICISGNGPTLVSQNGTTLLWNHTLPAAITDKIQALHSPSLFLPRILAYRELFPEQWNATPFLLSGPEFVIYALTKQAITILPEIRYKPAYWSKDDLQQNNIPTTKLPPYIAPAQYIGLTTPEATHSLGLPKAIPVFSGAPDFVVALVGTNTLHAGAICDRAGSSEGLNLCTNTPLSDSRIRTLPSIIPDLWNASVLLPASGVYFAEYKQHIEQETQRSISYDELVKNSYQDTHSPGYSILQTLAQKTKEGLQLLQAKALEAHITIAPVISITGGQTKSQEWMQLKADLISQPLGITSCNDAELIGDAILGWVGLQVYQSITHAAENMVKYKIIYKPRN
ncbi:MAG: hypothetical protein K6E51_01090 [Treponema sp.]|nr:hypothetical protein [Treponema sp.]